MVAFLALLAEATNAISAAVIVSCLLLVTVLIMRYQHGDEGGWGGSSVVRVENRPVQVAVQKLFVPYTLAMVREEGAVGSGSGPPSAGVTRLRLRCGAVGRGVLVRWWWGVRRDALLALLHAPWQRHHATVRDSSALHGCSGSLELDEGSHSVLLELPEGRHLGLGHAPRAGYPLVVVQLDPAEKEDDQYRVGSVVSLLHVPDAACPEPARMLYQYLKQRTGQLTLVTTLFTQANGVEPSTAPNANQRTASTSDPSAESAVTAPEQAASTSFLETDASYKETLSSSLSRSHTVASDEVLGRSSLTELDDGQGGAETHTVISSSSKGLGIIDSKDDDVITGWEWQSEEDEELERELNDQDTNCSPSSFVSDSRPAVEEVILGENEMRGGMDTTGNTKGRVAGLDSISSAEGCSSGETLHSRLVAADDRLLVDDKIHHSSDVDRVSCIQSLRLIDCPNDQGFAKNSEESSKEVNRSAATGTDTGDSAPNSGKTKDSRQLPSTPNLSVGPGDVSSSGTCIDQSGDKATLKQQPTGEENTPSAPVEEAEADERQFSSSDCVVCQECSTSLALLPCRHVCVCFSCFDQLMASPQQACPLCRQRVQAFFEV